MDLTKIFFLTLYITMLTKLKESRLIDSNEEENSTIDDLMDLIQLSLQAYQWHRLIKEVFDVDFLKKFFTQTLKMNIYF